MDLRSCRFLVLLMLLVLDDVSARSSGHPQKWSDMPTGATMLPTLNSHTAGATFPNGSEFPDIRRDMPTGATMLPTLNSHTADRILWSCSFEMDFCNMTQFVDDNFFWQRTSTSTGALESISYLYAESSDPIKYGETARIETQPFNYDGGACLTFYYHMYGNETGRLLVYTANDTLFDEAEDHGNRWIPARLNVRIHSGERIIFESAHSGLGIDEIQLDQHYCLEDLELKYDCRVHSLGCLNAGTCDVYTGFCSCIPPYDGYDCGQNTSVTCSKACENGGVCINNLGTEKCYCESYIGDTCETNRLLLMCNSNDMTMKISPHIDTSLKSFVSVTGIDDPSCKFSESAGEWSATVLNGACGMISDENPTVKKMNRSVSYLLRYIKDVDTSIDKRITWTCMESTDGGSIKTTVEINQATAPDSTVQVSRDVNAEVPSGVTIYILDKDGNGLDANTAYPLGTELQLVWDLDTTNYADIHVTSLTTYNDSFPLILDRCLTTFSGNIRISFGSSSETIDGILHKKIIFRFKLFRVLDDADKLTLKTVFMVCKDPATCAGADCSTNAYAHQSYSPNNLGRRRRAAEDPENCSPNNLGRRRRAAEDPENYSQKNHGHQRHAAEDPETGKATLQVRIAPDPYNLAATMDAQAKAQCVTNAGFLIPLVLLLVLLIIVVAAACFFCNRANRFRSQLDKLRSQPYNPE